MSHPLRMFCLAAVCALLCLQTSVFGQDGFDLANPVKITGSLGLNTGFYTSFGAPNRRDPFQYLLSANINFKLLGQIDVPFSANFSQQEANFRQPFNQYGISPSYKWATLHIGYRNMNFSEFTLAGHTFLGAGFDLRPGPWRVSGVYGRFRRSVDEATALLEGVDPVFRRIGYGLKVGYEVKGDMVALSVFKARDDLGSISLPVENDQVLPEENLVLGLTARKKITKKLSLELDAAQSAVTRDIRGPLAATEGSATLGYFGPLFQQRASSQTHPALNAKLNYKGKTYTIGLNYRRVDTDYRTLGAYFFNNDIEEATVKLGKRLLKGKLNLNANVGGQRNNLQADKATRSSRLVGSASVSYAPVPSWTFSLNASNFSSFLRVQRDLLTDSLNFYQVTRNASLNIAHTMGSDDRPQNLGLSIAYQDAVGRTEYAIEPENATDFLNIALTHRINIKPQTLGINSSLSFASSNSNGMQTIFFGPVAGVNKDFLDKRGKVGYRVSYQQVIIDGATNSAVLINAVNSSLKLWEKHGVSASMQYLTKSGNAAFSEMRGTVGYMFQF
ncbi:MAG: hypothetical protein AAGN35_24780 [Bacteroidota bacterium]